MNKTKLLYIRGDERKEVQRANTPLQIMRDTRDKGDLTGSLTTYFKNENVLVFSLQIVSIFLSPVCPPV